MHVRSTYISPRTDFGPAPKAYVPGAGRGAVGFTTRSDIGPARQAVVPIDRSISAQKERARQILLHRQLPGASINGAMLPATPGAMVGAIEMDIYKEKNKYRSYHNSNSHHHSNLRNTNNKISDSSTAKEIEDLNDSNYDAFAGYASNLFSAGAYDDEDIEADLIYAAIDKRQDSKRRDRREKREKEQWVEYHRKRPKIHEFFAKEKLQLKKLALSEWDNIPEAADLSRRRRSHLRSTRTEKYTPVPDSIIEGAHRSMNTNTNASVDEMDTRYGGWETRVPLLSRNGTLSSIDGTLTSGLVTADLTHLGRARDRHLGIQLDRMADSVTGQTVVDPKGYLTDLTSFHITSETDVSDIRKARQLLKSVTTTNPKHPPGWIAAARLEEAAGKIQAARNLILEGTLICPSSQDIWLEAARLHNRKQAKCILATAVCKIPTSVQIWMRAAKYESDIECQKAVLRKALSIIPNSVELWKAAVSLEDANDARIMLSRATECVSNCVDMWLALARLETYENAKRVLNKARIYCPTDPAIFIASAKLEEKHGNAENIRNIISKAIKTLTNAKIVINRNSWLNDASKCESVGCPKTCREIVIACIGIDVEDQDRFARWSKDAKDWTNKGHIEVARSIYHHMLLIFPKKQKLWWDAARLERKFGTPILCSQVLKESVLKCPKAVELWLFYARHEWTVMKNISNARNILQQSFLNNPHSEKIWLAATRLEVHNECYEEARKILCAARKDCSSAKVWLQSAKLERQLSQTANEEVLLKEAVHLFPDFDKLWMMYAQLFHRKGDILNATKVCQKAVEYCPQSSDFWLEYSRIERSRGRHSKARSVLQNATLKHPKNDMLWLASAKLELKANMNVQRNKKRMESELYAMDTSNIFANGGYSQAKALISKGIQQCPTSGLLWAFTIEVEPLASKKGKCTLAIKRCPNDVHVFREVARYLQQIGKYKSAREWFERSVIANGKCGDSWAYYLYFVKHFFHLQMPKKKRKINNSLDSIEKQNEKLIQRCISADPKYGILWIKISKKVGNEMLSVREILLKVVEVYIAPFGGTAPLYVI